MSEDKKPFGSTKNISELKAPFYFVHPLSYYGDKPILIRVNKIDDYLFDISECLPNKRPFGLTRPFWPKERVLFQNYFLAWAHYQKILARHQKFLALKPFNR